MRILVVGDTFIPSAVFARAFAPLEGEHAIEFRDVDAARAPSTATRSTRDLREFQGDPGEVAAWLADHDVLVVHGAPVTAEVLDAAPALALVACARGGPVNVDVAAATQRGLPVVTTPGKNAEAVADLTLAFIVMLARGLPRAQRFLLDGGRVGESNFEGAEFLGRELGGMTLGLVGFGNVGRRVARRASGFGMEVVVHDPYARDLGHADGPPVVALDELLGTSDVVSLHARATPETVDRFGPRVFAAMKPGALFVNTARASLVDESALLAALREGRLAGAALDVVRPDGERDALLARPDVIVTPHLGGATHETLLRGGAMLAAQIERFAAGAPLEHLANPEVLAEAT